MLVQPISPAQNITRPSSSGGTGPMKRFVTLVAVLAVALGSVATAAAADPAEFPLLIEKNRFQPDVIKVKAGASFVLVITNKDKGPEDRKSTRLNSSHMSISYAVFCLKKK